VDDIWFIHSPRFDEIAYPDECPFRTERAGACLATVRRLGLIDESRALVEPAPASREELRRLHEEGYLQTLERSESGQVDERSLWAGLGTPETPIFPGMVEYASLASGATLLAARAVADGRVRSAFNPSGGFHHAHAGRAAGFCYMNDVALACDELARRGKRVLFLDLDVHHCDGVQEFFYRRRDVMTLSLHQSGRTLFPFTGFEDDIGEGDGEGYSVNVPLPPGTDDVAYLRAFEAVAWPLIGVFDPDVLIVEWGMDTLAQDPLAQLQLTNQTLATIARRLMTLSKPTVHTGGGGYHVENTSRGWALLWAEWTGADTGEDLVAGLGGVLLGTGDWLGGLRDPPTIIEPSVRAAVDAEVDAVIAHVKRRVFPRHGLNPS